MTKFRPSGGYRDMCSFQTATLIYDATVWFCERFIDGRSRLVDQMVQAARSGRQNIAEGSRAAATSSQTELRLVNVARASLEELLLDYEDFLRQRGLAQWEVDSAEALAVRQVPVRFKSSGQNQANRADLTDLSDGERRKLYAPWLEHESAAVRANTLICLIHQANYLLDRQIGALEKAFVEEGGYSEQLASARMAHAGKSKQTRPMRASGRIEKSRPARNAAASWPCARRRLGRMPADNSGAAPSILIAKAWSMSD
jgi:four helix bundle suffix protein